MEETTTAIHALDVWQTVAGILVENESDPFPAKVIDLVAQYEITAYDGQFIALAMETGILCVTEDGELQSKFRRVAVTTGDFLKPPTISGVRERREAFRRSRNYAFDFHSDYPPHYLKEFPWHSYRGIETNSRQGAKTAKNS
jgi:hypothetical protein